MCVSLSLLEMATSLIIV